MPRIRVVFSIGALHGGGSERQLVSLLRNLDRSRFEPFLYLIYRSGPLLDLVPTDVPVAAFEERVTPSRIYLPGLMHQRRVLDFANYLREVQADVSYDRTFLMTMIAAAGAQRAGVPNISTIVTDPEVGFAPVAGRFQWFKRRILHRLYNRSSCVLAVSAGARESAIRFYGIAPQKIRTLPNGVDLELLRCQSQVSVTDPWWTGSSTPEQTCSNGHDSDHQTEGIFRIVSAGRLNEQKGFHFLIRAIAELKVQHPDKVFRLAILGEGSWRSRLQSLIDKLELSDQVRLSGFSNNAAAWYSTADLFVLPSLMEGSPNVLLEAMALGIPVVSTDCPSGPREILRSGLLGELVAPSDTQAIVRAVDNVIRNRPQSNVKAQAALRAIEVEHSISTACARFEQILLEVVERPQAD